MPGQKIPLIQPILQLRRLISVTVPPSIDLLRGQSSSSCFPPSNRPVETSKLVFAVCPAVVPAILPAIAPAIVPTIVHPNKFISKNS